MNAKQNKKPNYHKQNRNKRYNRRGRGKPHQRQHINPENLSKEQVKTRYLELQTTLQKARTEYFEYYHRTDRNKKKSLEDKYYQKLEQLRKFEQSLSTEQKSYLKEKTDQYGEDLIYSSNHELPIDGEVEENLIIEDPHFLESQKSEDFKEDTEESIGSMEDYLSYKGTH